MVDDQREEDLPIIDEDQDPVFTEEYAVFCGMAAATPPEPEPDPEEGM